MPSGMRQLINHTPPTRDWWRRLDRNPVSAHPLAAFGSAVRRSGEAAGGRPCGPDGEYAGDSRWPIDNANA